MKGPIHFVFALVCLMCAALSVPSHGQAADAPHFEMYGGPIYLRALDGDGFGAQIDIRASVPGELLGGESALGARFWMSGLGTPNAWLDDLRVTGFGVNWRNRWTVLDNRLRAHITVPLELIVAGQYGIQELDRICVLTDGDWICELSRPQTAPAMGVAGGFDLRLVAGLQASAAVNVFWMTLERSDGATEVLAFLGLGYSFGGVNW